MEPGIVRRLVAKTINKIPPVRSYLDEKVELSQKVADQQAQINHKNLEIDNLHEHIKLVKGESPESIDIKWPVFKEDILAAASAKRGSASVKTTSPFKLAWVVPPMGTISGGHTDIFRTISYLEARGHQNSVYFYDAIGHHSHAELKKLMKANYPKVKAATYYNESEFKDCDAIFATNWFTAYPVLNFKKKVKKYYYVQDYEPWFDPAGSYSSLAEQTYSFGFKGLTLGKWLEEKLGKDFDMECQSFSFGVDPQEYQLINKSKRQDVVLYARPGTPRRGFEMAVFALEIFHKRNPDSKIHFVGWDVSSYKLPFPYINHGVLPHKQLNDVYNQCAAGLVISFTNMSLMPIEMLLAGCQPVVNDAYHTRKIEYAERLTYSAPNPQALANTLEAAVRNAKNPDISKALKREVEALNWDRANDQIEKILLKDLS